MDCQEPDEIICKLKECTKKTKKFTLEGCVKICKVVSVYDGDSCRVVFNHNGQINKWNIRMNGYDSPEMRPSKSKPNREAEKAAAVKAKEYLKSLIMKDKQLVYIKCGKFDKYGRLLGEIYINKNDKKSINQIMVDERHGYAYDGGTKKAFKVSAV